MKPNKNILYILIFLVLTQSQTLIGQDSTQTKVFVMELKTEIDNRTTRYVELALKSANEQNADIVIIEMDTYGGVLTDANEVRTMIMDFEKPVWVFINKDAASAGALISIACDSIYMAPGSNIGAATVVNGEDGQAAPDKYQSYMRSIMRSTAQENGRDPKIAEGMVDENMEIDSVKVKGQVITFSTEEALKYGFCEAEVKSIDEILARNKVEDYVLIKYELSTSENAIAFFINPFISGILILLILGGLYFELQSPGIGFPLIVSVTALILYLTPYYLNGLAENWEIIVLAIGLVLILAEIFVIPGFGVAGISGITMVAGSLILIMINNDFFNFDFVPKGNILGAMAATFGGILGAILLIIFGSYRITQMKAFERFALKTEMNSSEGYTTNFKLESLIGKKGVAHTILRPSGRVMINNTVYDAFTRGEFIEVGDDIEVVEETGNLIKVRKA